MLKKLGVLVLEPLPQGNTLVRQREEVSISCASLVFRADFDVQKRTSVVHHVAVDLAVVEDLVGMAVADTMIATVLLAMMIVVPIAPTTTDLEASTAMLGVTTTMLGVTTAMLGVTTAILGARIAVLVMITVV